MAPERAFDDDSDGHQGTQSLFAQPEVAGTCWNRSRLQHSRCCCFLCCSSMPPAHCMGWDGTETGMGYVPSWPITLEAFRGLFTGS